VATTALVLANTVMGKARLVIDKLAEFQKLPSPDVDEITSRNARKLFDIHT